MNATQQKLVEMKKKIPDCTASRQRLRSILSDYFPTDKQLINPILDAYDEDIESKLRSSTDRTLMALQMVKTLQCDYGLTATSAMTSVESWCYILGYYDVGEAISIVQPESSVVRQNSSLNNAQNSKPINVTHGIFMAGLDFPAGEIRLRVLSIVKDKDAQKNGIYYAILKKGSVSNQIITNGFIKTQAILTINPGQRLETGWQGELELTPVPEVT